MAYKRKTYKKGGYVHSPSRTKTRSRTRTKPQQTRPMSGSKTIKQLKLPPLAYARFR